MGPYKRIIWVLIYEVILSVFLKYIFLFLTSFSLFVYKFLY